MGAFEQFQSLPSLVIERIIEFTVNHSRHHYSDFIQYASSRDVMMSELLNISSKWNTIVFSQVSGLYRIQVLGKNNSYENMTLWPSCIKQSSFCFVYLAKELLLEVSYGSILNGTAVQEILRVLRGKRIFGSVRVLRIKFAYFDILGENVSVEHTQKFIDHIKYMVPGVTRVVLEGTQFPEPMDIHAGLSLGMLITGLYGMAKDIEYKGVGQPITAAIDHSVLTELTRIDYEWNSSYRIYLQMIHHSANSLQALNIKNLPTDTTIDLVCDEHGNTIVYPKMRHLKLDMDVIPIDDPRPTVAQGAPFPNLEQLIVLNRYPFGDNTLIRGNCKTLEYLDVYIDAETMLILMCNNYNCDGNPVGLRHLAISRDGYLYEDYIEMLSTYYQEMAPELETLSLDVYVSSEAIVPSITSIPQFKNIRILTLPNVSFDVFKVLQLVQELPLLSDMHTKLAGTSQYPEGIKKGKLPLHVYKNYYPASQNFKQLVMTSDTVYDAKGLAISAMLIAIACPNFTFVAMQDNILHEYNKHLKRMIKTGAYAKYADRLRSLIYEGM